MRIDDDLLMAFLDGELDEVTRARVERALAEDPELQVRLDIQRRLRDRLAAHYAPVAEEEVPERFRAMLETNVVALPAARSRPLWQTFVALAATLVLGLFIGRAITSPGPIAVEDGIAVARAELADALETQLASTQPPGAVTRIGVTFQRGDGRLCRTFDSGATAGLACRDGAGWQLMMTASRAGGGAEGGFRQAGTGNALVLQAAQELMTGEPLDAARERQARDSGWRTNRPSR